MEKWIDEAAIATLYHRIMENVKWKVVYNKRTGGLL
jgi:hypothetical protein